MLCFSQKTAVQQTVIDTYTRRVIKSYMEGKYIIPQVVFAHTSESLDSSVLIHSCPKVYEVLQLHAPNIVGKVWECTLLTPNASVLITMPIKTWMKVFGVEEIDCSAHYPQTSMNLVWIRVKIVRQPFSSNTSVWPYKCIHARLVKNQNTSFFDQSFQTS